MDTVFAPFLTGFALSSALIMAIGAQNLFVLRQGLRGEHVGPIVLFCGLSDSLLIMLGVGGVGAFLTAAPNLSILLATGGAAFLVWHGVAALRRMLRPPLLAAGTEAGLSLARAMLATAGFTFMNPHVYLDTVLMMGVAGSAQPPAGRTAFVIGASCASFAWFAGLGYGARLLQPWFSRPKAWRVLDGVVGTIMLSLAASLLAGVGAPTH